MGWSSAQVCNVDSDTCIGQLPKYVVLGTVEMQQALSKNFHFLNHSVIYCDFIVWYINTILLFSMEIAHE